MNEKRACHPECQSPMCPGCAVAPEFTKPRTNADIIADLLQLAIDGEWSGQVNTSCHCHPEYASCCPECEALQYQHANFGAKRAHGEHEKDCKRMALIEEARAFLRVENILADERGEEGIHVP